MAGLNMASTWSNNTCFQGNQHNGNLLVLNLSMNVDMLELCDAFLAAAGLPELATSAYPKSFAARANNPLKVVRKEPQVEKVPAVQKGVKRSARGNGEWGAAVQGTASHK